MRVLYYDCFAGISGDMNLAAMIDCGVPLSYLEEELKKLGIEGYEITAKKSLKMGISGTQVDVVTPKPEKIADTQSHGHGHGHGHGHSYVLADTNQQTAHSHEHAGEHRAYRDIKKIINSSSLETEVKKTSIDIFEKVAIAEAKIHNKTVEDVHFHEVGAIDSIVDIVGAAICYHFLKPEKVLCSTIELGGGFVQCAHGKFPVPAPATAEILKGLPIKMGTVQVETTTPTGAAILATLVDEFTDSPSITINKIAYGLGHRNLSIPNVLRVYSGEMLGTSNQEKALVVECNLDDMPAEYYSYLMDKLFNSGAHDVYLTPIIMKKSRPAVTVSVLCSHTGAADIESILFSETTTLGIRSYEVNKKMLERKVVSVHTMFGKIDIKVAGNNNSEFKYKPEYEQCREAAEKFNVPLRRVIEEAIKEFKSKDNE